MGCIPAHVLEPAAGALAKSFALPVDVLARVGYTAVNAILSQAQQAEESTAEVAHVIIELAMGASLHPLSQIVHVAVEVVEQVTRTLSLAGALADKCGTGVEGGPAVQTCSSALQTLGGKCDAARHGVEALAGGGKVATDVGSGWYDQLSGARGRKRRPGDVVTDRVVVCVADRANDWDRTGKESAA